jgi:hypothetical protein
MYYTQREVDLTVYGHEWYWVNVYQRIQDGKQQGRWEYHMPLLHQYYGIHRHEMPSFPIFRVWFDAILSLGCPVEPRCFRNGEVGRWTKPVFHSWKDREQAVLRFLLLRSNEQEVKRRRRWSLPYGGKWQKEWEPDAETWQKKKDAREAKKEWRDQLQKNKGRRRRLKYHCGPGRWHKKERSSLHRAWVREQIQRENWEAFWSKERELFCDPWSWS